MAGVDWEKRFSVTYISISALDKIDGRIFIYPQSPLTSQSLFIELQYYRDKGSHVLHNQGNSESLTGQHVIDMTSESLLNSCGQ